MTNDELTETISQTIINNLTTESLLTLSPEMWIKFSVKTTLDMLKTWSEQE